MSTTAPGNAEPQLGEKTPHAKPEPSTPPDFEELVTRLSSLAESLRGIQELGVAQSTPIVEAILRTRSRDVRHIEQTLDRLLDITCHPDGLQLYRRLCRHYWDIDPAATAEYVLIYHKMWEQQEERGAKHEIETRLLLTPCARGDWMNEKQPGAN